MSESKPLEKVGFYPKAKISSDKVSIENFVTVDNLSPNKAGISISEIEPAGLLTEFKAGDTLVGNIRPYLKKIWFADHHGGATQDVLTIRPKPGTDPRFLYYALFRDDFFSHMMKGAKGTKMPRGDRDHVLTFLIPEFNEKDERSIAAVLSALDAKIELNNRINAELERTAKTIYDYWFVQFDFPDANGRPYKTSGGKMTYNPILKREIPDGWDLLPLRGFENEIVTGKTPSTEEPENYGNDIPFITIGDIRGNMHVTRTEIGLTRKGADTQKKKYIPEGSLCVTCIASPGLIAFATQESQTNQQINSIAFQNNENRAFLYFALKNHFGFSSGAKVGNTFANMNKDDFAGIRLVRPDRPTRNRFQSSMEPIFLRIKTASCENRQLAALRDWLLPMLMNGQVTVR